MKYISTTAILVLLSANLLRAQQEPSIVIPGSPAFSILQFEPASVVRPSSAKSLGADILHAFDRNGKLQLNLGMEFSPYWLKSRPYLTRKQYLESGFGQTLVQSFQVSVATVKDSANGDNKLGLGFRCKLLNGKPIAAYYKADKLFQKKLNITAALSSLRDLVKNDLLLTQKELVEQLLANLKAVRPLIDELVIGSIKEMAMQKQEGLSDSKEDLLLLADAIANEYDAANLTLKTQILTLSKKRTGFILELAGAAGLFTDKKKHALDRAGFWVTASNTVSGTDAVNFNLRYFFSNRDTAMSNIDAGISYTKDLSQFSISLEAMVRWYSADVPYSNSAGLQTKRVERNCSYRLAIQSAYRVSDFVSINLSLGKGFTDPFIASGSYFSAFGLNYTLFNKQRTDLAK